MLHYLEGDATNPIGTGHKIIAHVCNDVGGWGRGFVLALSKKWQQPELSYRHWASTSDGTFQLGKIQLVRVEKSITVINMIAQHDVVTKNNIPPIRYDALRECLVGVGDWSISLGATVHMPRIGCGLAGGLWVDVEKIINAALENIDVFVYDLPNNPIPWK